MFLTEYEAKEEPCPFGIGQKSGSRFPNTGSCMASACKIGWRWGPPGAACEARLIPGAPPPPYYPPQRIEAESQWQAWAWDPRKAGQPYIGFKGSFEERHYEFRDVPRRGYCGGMGRPENVR